MSLVGLKAERYSSHLQTERPKTGVVSRLECRGIAPLTSYGEVTTCVSSKLETQKETTVTHILKSQ